MFRAYPRHSVDISGREYCKILSSFFCLGMLRGDGIQLFEKAFKDYIGTPYASSIPSARLGLFLIFKSFNLPQGTEIIISPFTHWSIFTVIKSCGLKPVFVDIDEHTYNIDPKAVRKAINKNTKVIILTHMWGQPCNMNFFLGLKKEFGLKIIEDCAMACGATYENKKVGSFGDASIFSFGKAKAISTFGGGMLCANDRSIYEQACCYSNNFSYGKRSSLAINIVNSIIANILTRPSLFFLSIYPLVKILNIRDPYNPIEHRKDASVIFDRIPEEWKIKMSNIQAVVGIEQLKNLDIHNHIRIRNARILNNILHDAREVCIPVETSEAKHIYLYYALYIKKNIQLNDLRKILISKHIDSQLNELTTSKELEIFGVHSSDYPVFNEVSQKLLIIPNGIYLTKDDIIYVGNTSKKIIESIQ
jgi:perosamine synthetase